MNGWRFAMTIDGNGFYAFHPRRMTRYYGHLDMVVLTEALTFERATRGGLRGEITAEEAYAICQRRGDGSRFCDLTGYRP